MSHPNAPEPAAGRVIDLSVEVPGTPEEVWQAVATGPGITSWFVPHKVAEHEGGAVTMHFGVMGDEQATVRVWEPPHRVVFVDSREQLAYEWLVEAKDSGTCVVRLVNSGFGPEQEWDNDYDSMTKGWTILLQNLRLHLTHFRGQHAQSVVPLGTATGPNAAAFAAVCAAFGIPDDLGPGDRLESRGDGIPRLSGTVDLVNRMPGATAYLFVLDSPALGTGFITAEGDGDSAVVSSYLYFYTEDGRQVADEWTPLFAERFPLPAP